MIHFEEGNRKEELFDMWQRIFHDTMPYTQYYFDEIYGKNEILLEEKEDNLRGMLHLNPYQMQMGEDYVNVHYIVGVSTEEEYRRQGVMRSLLEESFKVLRERKEPFTYLMPADPAYYLPFDFRYGMVQYEQEVELGIVDPVDAGYVLERAALVDFEEYAATENAWKKNQYDISTLISADYLRRFNEEAKSEFGCFFYVKKNGTSIGRFVVYAEDDFLAISQMVCYDNELRQEFLQQILQFCDGRYHFRQYRITFAEDWKDDLLVSKQFGQLHVFQTREYPIIMFRILNLEELAKWLRAKEKVSCILKVEDQWIKEQNGVYRFDLGPTKSSIERLNDDMNESSIDGCVDIASLADRIFGNLSKECSVPETFHENAVALWKAIKEFDSIEISEIV